ncbi:GNAT family N-acetyltransferase [Natronolimnohabitans innermongolicus]|uniref:N-acetyltransferase GCN5 n=1 Tax=Natronolimnohabitans innermongolicus JCM 12255 TaxID=1227499 RepID=L9X010_9EURY|nr:GNAT family N-acetyltransferase [Natronolimnohabitans innermongolicus]ELY55030.1 N-acetyltransferase GCN5 [Natronolimnohabitans innermongolicus JCM 12255]
MSTPIDGHVRTATAADHLEVRRILDAAMLEPGDVEIRIEEGNVLVAGDDRGGRGGADADAERILGTIVLESGTANDYGGAHVAAIGVRRRHRGRGIGRALIQHALEREGRLTARFDEGVRPFYESLEFSIEPVDDRRYRGVVSETGAD